jgi:hypothetical protein
MTVMAVEAAEGAEDAATSGTLAGTQRQRLARQNPPPVPSGNGNNPQRQSQSASGPTINIAGGNSYHRWVMAEFIACIILTGVTPLLSKPKDADGNDVNLDAKAVLFGADALVRLSALCAVFFILALLANHEKSGKFSAAFGGLITAALLVNTDPAIWTKLGDIFGGAVGSGVQPKQGSSSPGAAQKLPSTIGSNIKSAVEQALKQLIPWG